MFIASRSKSSVAKLKNHVCIQDYLFFTA